MIEVSGLVFLFIVSGAFILGYLCGSVMSNN
jgi:hypothetical protein